MGHFNGAIYLSVRIILTAKLYIKHKMNHFVYVYELSTHVHADTEIHHIRYSLLHERTPSAIHIQNVIGLSQWHVRFGLHHAVHFNSQTPLDTYTHAPSCW